MIFISHDARDAQLAEAFSKLLRSVSAGMLKSFRSSDKKGTEGIEFGDEWYKRLMDRLGSASDVVCLLTERSVERPWILYEAGVAKGKLNTPVFGIALGVSLSSVGVGPFYQFQNSDDSEDSLTKLVKQLASRIPSLEPDEDVVRAQVQTFKKTADQMLASLSQPDDEPEEETPSDSAAAKLFEELKIMLRDLASRFEAGLGESEGVRKRRRMLRFHPRMLEETMNELGGSGPAGFLLFASMVQDDAPWLAELAREAFRAMALGPPGSVRRIQRMLETLRGVLMDSPLLHRLGDSKSGQILVIEGPRLLDHLITRQMEDRKSAEG